MTRFDLLLFVCVALTVVIGAFCGKVADTSMYSAWFYALWLTLMGYFASEGTKDKFYLPVFICLGGIVGIVTIFPNLWESHVLKLCYAGLWVAVVGRIIWRVWRRKKKRSVSSVSGKQERK